MHMHVVGRNTYLMVILLDIPFVITLWKTYVTLAQVHTAHPILKRITPINTWM
jgi:hypothetical protein